MEVRGAHGSNGSSGPNRTRRLSIDGKATTKRVGLFLASDTTLDEWRLIGREIGVIHDASGWWLGDWLVYGQERYPERYRQAIDETGLDYQTLRNYAWIARRFEMHRRRDKLSIQHHVEVAALSEVEQDLWLDRAEHFSWSRNALREQLKATRQATLESSASPRMRLNVEITSEQRTSWTLAAQDANLELNEWINSVLDEAAAAVASRHARNIGPSDLGSS
ncbi:LmbU family transcriptional regulator [Nonomuraea sp. M3C6]|uniref:LmbU family transcriptional regulator n=1 Tax=Nonomuraea marmarensis TaxID=3351344 RepID=A0ABW7AXD3_9ACTN